MASGAVGRDVLQCMRELWREPGARDSRGDARSPHGGGVSGGAGGVLPALGNSASGAPEISQRLAESDRGFEAVCERYCGLTAFVSTIKRVSVDRRADAWVGRDGAPCRPRLPRLNVSSNSKLEDTII